MNIILVILKNIQRQISRINKHVLNNITTIDEENNKAFDSLINQTKIEHTNPKEHKETKHKQTETPIYDDINKNLSFDEKLDTAEKRNERISYSTVDHLVA